MIHLRTKVYQLVASVGITTLQRLFPADFQSEPLKPTDRYLEYPFAIRNLPSPPAIVLDVGCSGSFFPLLLAAFGYDTYAMDLREYAITNRIDIPNFRFVRGDIRKTDFPDDYFDAVTAISSVEHIGVGGRYGTDDDPEGDKCALREMERILSPQGCILLTIPFGRAKVIRPHMRVYDGCLMHELVDGLIIQKQEYYMQDLQDDWFPCSSEAAEHFEAQADRYPLGLLKLVKS